jgi:hypothetical protein
MKKAMLALLIAIGFSPAAQAADLYTSPVWGGIGGTGGVSCKVANSPPSRGRCG